MTRTGCAGVAPRFSVKMKTEYQVGFDFFVDDLGARGGSLRLDRIIVRLPKGPNLRAWGRPVRSRMGEYCRSRDRVVRSQPGSLELFGANSGHRPRGGTNQSNLGSQALEPGSEKLGDPQRQISFHHRNRVSDLEPTFFHLGPRSAEMAWINGNPDPIKGQFIVRTETPGRRPIARHRFAGAALRRIGGRIDPKHFPG